MFQVKSWFCLRTTHVGFLPRLGDSSLCALQVKKVPGTASPEDSAVVHGLVCRKNVAHKRMRTHIKQPRIIMLGNTLEYHRTKHKLSSFDTLLDQVL